MLYALGKNFEGWCFRVLHHKHFHLQSQGERKWPHLKKCWFLLVVTGQERELKVRRCVIGLEQVLQSAGFGTFWNTFLFTVFFWERGTGRGYATKCRWMGVCYHCTRIWKCTLFKCVLPADMKSVSEKCWMHTYCCCSFLVCSALHDMPNLSAYSCALCNNKITN